MGPWCWPANEKVRTWLGQGWAEWEEKLRTRFSPLGAADNGRSRLARTSTLDPRQQSKKLDDEWPDWFTQEWKKMVIEGPRVPDGAIPPGLKKHFHKQRLRERSKGFAQM